MIVKFNVLKQTMENGKIESEDMFLKSEKSFSIPSGVFSMWERL